MTNDEWSVDILKLLGDVEFGAVSLAAAKTAGPMGGDIERPLMLYENFALRIPGVTREMVEAAKKYPQPCPKDWPVAQSTWKVITPIPTTTHER